MKGWLKKAVAVLGEARNMPARSVAGTPLVAEVVATGMGHHQAGRLTEAEKCYRRVLADDPDHYDALHLLGVVRHQIGDSAQAMEFIGRAVAVAPSNPLAYANLGTVYQALNRHDEAEESLRRALTLKPDWDQPHNALGTVLQARGELEGAEACFRKALTFNPSNVEALSNLGNVRKELGDLQQAEECYRQTLALKDIPEVYNNLGNVLQQRGHAQRAEESYRRALELKPDYAEAYNNLGSLLRSQGKLDEAEACYQQALAIKPGLAEAFCNLGDVFTVLGRLDEAEAHCRKALTLKPAYPDALNNLGSVFKARGHLDVAEAHYRQALSLDARHSGAHNNLGTLCAERGKLDDAEAWYRQALLLTRSGGAAQVNLAMLRLLRGDYAEGLRLYENRFDTFASQFVASKGLHDQLQDVPRWQGEALSGKRILVWTEQGLGDSLMVMRYLPQLKERGAAKVIVHCEHSLERTMRAMPGVDDVTPQGDALSKQQFDLHCPMMSLPYLFAARRDSLPNHVPYLSIPAPLINLWRERLSGIQKIRVGLVWAGGKALRDDAKRSIPLSKFAPLFETEGVQFISLQKGDETRQLAECGHDMLDWMGACEDFMDTGAQIENLDLVICVDTAVAHLAGALGKPVWLLNRYASEWRWGLDREDSPWYPTMRIFRQRTRDDWTEVIERVSDAFRQRQTSHETNETTPLFSLLSVSERAQ